MRAILFFKKKYLFFVFKGFEIFLGAEESFATFFIQFRIFWHKNFLNLIKNKTVRCWTKFQVLENFVQQHAALVLRSNGLRIIWIYGLKIVSI